MLAGVHAQQGDVTAHGFKFLAKVAHGDGFAIFQRIRKFFAEE
jgi:hypothetical protein